MTNHLTRAALVLFLGTAAVHASDFKSVTVDLSASSVGAGVPFDEPFVIAGTAAAQVQRIIFSTRSCRAARR